MVQRIQTFNIPGGGSCHCTQDEFDKYILGVDKRQGWRLCLESKRYFMSIRIVLERLLHMLRRPSSSTIRSSYEAPHKMSLDTVAKNGYNEASRTEIAMGNNFHETLRTTVITICITVLLGFSISSMSSCSERTSRQDQEYRLACIENKGIFIPGSGKPDQCIVK